MYERKPGLVQVEYVGMKLKVSNSFQTHQVQLEVTFG